MTAVETDESRLVLSVDRQEKIKLKTNKNEMIIILTGTTISNYYGIDNIYLTDQIRKYVPEINSVQVVQYSMDPAEARIVIKTGKVFEPRTNFNENSGALEIELAQEKQEEAVAYSALPQEKAAPVLKPAYNYQEDNTSELEEALEARANKEKTKARSILESILSRNPDDLWANYYLAWINLESNNLESARQLTEKIMNNSPGFFASYYLMAIISELEGNGENAIELYKKSINIYPDYQDCHYRLGLIYLKRQELDKAKIEFKKVLSIYPEHSGALQNLGLIYLKESNIVRAKELLQQSVRSDALNNLGNIFLHEYNNNEAVKYFSFALSISPENAIYSYNLAKAYHELKNYEEALKYYQQTIEINPEISSAHYNMALIYAEQGQNARAVTKFTAYLEINPEAEDCEEVNSLISRLKAVKTNDLKTF